MMKVSWIAAAATDARSDWGHYPQDMKTVGPIWGSWRTWLNFGTDNVICHDPAKTRELMGRAFHAVCNFYVWRANITSTTTPPGIHLYDGSYRHDCPDIEDIVAMHLAASTSDMVLLLGFDLARQTVAPDNDGQRDRRGMIRSIIGSTPCQWVAIDHDRDLDPSFANLANCTRDTMENVLRLLT